MVLEGLLAQVALEDLAVQEEIQMHHLPGMLSQPLPYRAGPKG